MTNGKKTRTRTMKITSQRAWGKQRIEKKKAQYKGKARVVLTTLRYGPFLASLGRATSDDPFRGAGLVTGASLSKFWVY